MAAPANTPAVPLEVSKMSKVQKLATLLVIIGPEAAAQVMKHLDEHELDTVAGEMAKMTVVPQETQREILKEFTGVAVEASSAILGGLAYTQAALEKSVGLFRATNILGRVAPSRTPVAVMQQLADMEPRQIYNLLKLEQPQTRALNQTGGLKMAAELLNAVDRNLSKALLIALEERNAELGIGIRQKMFTFEDLVTLDPPSLQKILREIDMRDLAVSLKSA